MNPANTALFPRHRLGTAWSLLTSEPAVSRVPLDYQARLQGDVTEPPASLRFEYQVARFQRAVGHQRDAARSAIVKRLLQAGGDSDEYIQTLVCTLISSARPGRLDDAIDILAQCGNLLEHFVYEVLSQPQTAQTSDEDFWYALIRGIGKSPLPSARMLVELLSSKSPEAAVEALGDLGDDESLKRIRAVAAASGSEFIRDLAAATLDECSE
jgi:hypothetical protein